MSKLFSTEITTEESELLTFLKGLNAQGIRIQLSLWPNSDFRGVSTIRKTATNTCKVEANTTPRYSSFENISEDFYDDLVEHFHNK